MNFIVNVPKLVNLWHWLLFAFFYVAFLLFVANTVVTLVFFSGILCVRRIFFSGNISHFSLFKQKIIDDDGTQVLFKCNLFSIKCTKIMLSFLTSQNKLCNKNSFTKLKLNLFPTNFCMNFHS